MENAGCVTLRDEYVFRSPVSRRRSTSSAPTTILHEMAHMWFGDLVTMKWWDDLWLNESFAEWACYHARGRGHRVRPRRGPASPTPARTGPTARTSCPRRTRSPPTTTTSRPSRSTSTASPTPRAPRCSSSWSPGSARTSSSPGCAATSSGTRSATPSSPTCSAALEETSGRDLEAWAEEWLQTAGVNTLRREFELDDDGALHVVRGRADRAPADYPTLRRHRLGIGLYDRDRRPAWSAVPRSRSTSTGARTEVAELVGATQPDLLLLNDGDLTYAKIRLDERSLATVRRVASPRIDDSLARALCWGAAWDMTRDAEMSRTRLRDLVLRGIGQRDRQLGRAHPAAAGRDGRRPVRRPERRARGHRLRLADGLLALLRGRRAGQRPQLQLARAFAVGARAPTSSSTIVAGLLDGTERLDGLAIDTDLRWTCCTSWSRPARPTTPRSTASSTRDDTATGRRQAAAARAARPTAEAKAEAWAAVVDGDDLPNAIQTAVIGGFAQAGQLDLLRPVRRRVLRRAHEGLGGADQRDRAEHRDRPVPDAARRAGDAWTPRTRGCRRTPTPAPALRRLVGESRDGVARALRAQARDARD